MSTVPTVSVIIPAYNTAAFIAETLDSVFSQTFRDFEVIVINDGSPDTDVLERALKPYQPRIIYIKQENRGLAGARNTGIRRAQGKYLAFLDSDDCWFADYLASQMKMFEELPLTDAVYCDAEYFDNPDLAGKTCMQMCPSSGQVSIQALISTECQVLVSWTVALKRIVTDAGLFDETLRRCEDYDLWLRIAYHGGRIAYQRKVLGRYRSRPGSLSGDTAKMWETLIVVYEKAARTLELSKETMAILQKRLAQARANLDLEVGRSSLASGDFDEARAALKRANHVLRRAKLTIVIGGVQIAPRLTRLAVITWQKLLSRSNSLNQGRTSRPFKETET